MRLRSKEPAAVRSIGEGIKRRTTSRVRGSQEPAAGTEKPRYRPGGEPGSGRMGSSQRVLSEVFLIVRKGRGGLLAQAFNGE